MILFDNCLERTLQTVQVNELLPSSVHGWKITDPDSSGRYQDVTRFVRPMTTKEAIIRWAIVATITTLSLGVFALYLRFSTEGNRQFQNLLNRICIWYVDPSIPPYLSLPKDVRMCIEKHLPFNDWIQLRKLSHTTKKTVDKSMIVSDERITQLVDKILTKSWIWLERANFTHNQTIFARVLCALEARDPKRFSDYFNNYKIKWEFSRESLAQLSIPLCHQLLDLNLRDNKRDLNQNELDLYYEFASLETVWGVIQDDINRVEEHSKYDFTGCKTAAAKKTLQNLSRPEITQKLHAIAKLSPEHRKAVQRAIIGLASYACTFFRKITTILPDLTYKELREGIDALEVKRNEALLTPPGFLAQQCIDICDAARNGCEALELLKPLFMEAYAVEKSKKCHDVELSACISYWSTKLADALFEIVVVEPLQFNPHIAQNLAYCLMRLDNPYIAINFYERLFRGTPNHGFRSGFNFNIYNDKRTYFAAEWALSCHLSTFNAPFKKILICFDSVELVKILVESSNTLPEPRRSLYLRLIRSTALLDSASMDQAFSTPYEYNPVEEKELYLRLSGSSDFFSEVENIRSDEDLKQTIARVQRIKFAEQKSARLSLLVHGCSELPSLNYSVPVEMRQKAFEAQNLVIEDYGPISLKQFQRIEYEAFQLSRGQVPISTDNVWEDFKLLY